jgi:hypothetical chaperone protein
MHAGFDYGTSNCSIGVCRDDSVALLPLEDGATQIPSTLYAPRLQLQVTPRPAADVRGIDLAAQPFEALKFGSAALDAYLLQPGEGYFVKSPKSYLGAQGLSSELRDRFVGVVAAMMQNVRKRAEEALDDEIDDVVIGRPIHFQGATGVDEDAQALSMLDEAARSAGFRNIEFQYEPMAAAMDYESRLESEQCILVLDIGGGTTDCSFVRVGPSRRDSVDREADVLGHGGERVGGNDYDQLLALRCLMPPLGFGDELVSGLPIPNTYFVDAVSINDVNAQQRFLSARTTQELRRFVRESKAPERIARLLDVHRRRQTHRLVRGAEQAKIELSSGARARVDLGYLEQGLGAGASRADLATSCERLLAHLYGLVSEVVRGAGRLPDVVYLTGGMSGAAIVRQFLWQRFPDANFVDGDHFAAVTAGLTLWAERIYRA